MDSDTTKLILIKKEKLTFILKGAKALTYRQLLGYLKRTKELWTNEERNRAFYVGMINILYIFCKII